MTASQLVLSLLLLAILAGVTTALVFQGLWRSMVMLLNLLAAAAIATAWFAPLANLLDRYLGGFTYLLDFLSAWAIFCIAIGVMRAVTDRLTPVKVRFPVLVERIGVGIPAFLAGWVMTAFTAVTLHLAPLPRDTVQPTPEARMLFGTAPDRCWLSWIRGGSRSGPFARGAEGPKFDEKADFILRYADRRRKLEASPGLRVTPQ